MSMIRLTKAEEQKSRTESFARLRPDALFDLGRVCCFIAVKKLTDQEWEVIELTKGNRQKIIAGQTCETSRLHYDNMDCLNLLRWR